MPEETLLTLLMPVLDLFGAKIDYDRGVVLGSLLRERGHGIGRNRYGKEKEQQIANPAVINRKRSIRSTFCVRVAEK